MKTVDYKDYYSWNKTNYAEGPLKNFTSIPR